MKPGNVERVTIQINHYPSKDLNRVPSEVYSHSVNLQGEEQTVGRKKAWHEDVPVPVTWGRM